MSTTLPPIQDLTTYLIDLDGVVYRGEIIIEGAKDFVQWLNEQHKKYLFLTNNSFASETQVVEKLGRVGIVTDITHVMAASQAAVQTIAHRFPGGSVYIIGEQPLFDMVLANGLKVSNSDWQSTDAVLVGIDRTLNYQKLTDAILAIRKGAAFIAINRDPLLPIAGGALIAGCGAMVGAVESGSETSPDVIGKPEPALLQEAMRKLNSQPADTVMIGDNLGVDIKAGIAAGTRTLFVLSGKDTPEDLAKSTLKPDYIYADLAALMQKIKA
jgi:HAD superfamily hydrolase (TIGR01457 family)